MEKQWIQGRSEVWSGDCGGRAMWSGCSKRRIKKKQSKTKPSHQGGPEGVGWAKEDALKSIPNRLIKV